MNKKWACLFLLMTSTLLKAAEVSLSDLFIVDTKLHATNAGTIAYDGTCSGGTTTCPGGTINLGHVLVYFCTTGYVNGSYNDYISCYDQGNYYLATGSLNLTKNSARNLVLNSTAAGAMRPLAHNSPAAGSVNATCFSF